MPKLNENAKKIAQGHEILIIEGSTDEEEEMEKIKVEIEEKVNQIADKIIAAAEPMPDQAETKQEQKSFFGKLIGKK